MDELVSLSDPLVFSSVSGASDRTFPGVSDKAGVQAERRPPRGLRQDCIAIPRVRDVVSTQVQRRVSSYFCSGYWGRSIRKEMCYHPIFRVQLLPRPSFS